MGVRLTAVLSISLMVLVVAGAGTGRNDNSDQILWSWTGGVTGSSAVVKVAAATDAPVVLTLTDVASGAMREVTGTTEAAPSRTARNRTVTTFPLRDLSSGTQYAFQLRLAGSQEVSHGAFKTLETADDQKFTFAFASCAKSDHRIFSLIADRSPDLFIHMGDLHYANISRWNFWGSSPKKTAKYEKKFASAYDKAFGPHQRELFSKVPVVYVWDDHDYGPNNSGSWSASKDAARASYRTHVPRSSLGPTTIEQDFSVGPVRFLITDNRSERTKVSGSKARGERSMLGSEQKQWLLRQLARAAADSVSLVVWVNTVPWITNQGEKGDGWREYPSERTEIAKVIENHGLSSRMLILSGDAHMLAISDRSASNYSTANDTGTGGRAGGPLVFHAGPLNNKTSIKGGPYLATVPTKEGKMRVQQFGMATLTIRSRQVVAELVGMRHEEGKLVQEPRIKLTLKCDQRGCTP